MKADTSRETHLGEFAASRPALKEIPKFFKLTAGGPQQYSNQQKKSPSKGVVSLQKTVYMHIISFLLLTDLKRS